MKTTSLVSCCAAVFLSVSGMCAEPPEPKLPDEAQRIMREYDQAVDAARTRAVQALNQAMASQTTHGNLPGALAIKKQIEELSAPASAPEKKLVGRWKLIALDTGDSGEVTFRSDLQYEATKWWPGGVATIKDNTLTFGDGMQIDIARGITDVMEGHWHNLKRRMVRVK